jgi:hypothetical protein
MVKYPNEKEMRTANLIGAITANVYMLLVIAVFIARMLGQLEIGQWIGLASTLAIIPLAYLFVIGLDTNRRMIYFVWLGLMILFVLVELIIDHIFQLDFRSVQWAVILYVMFFFGATGGMIGVAAQAGRLWASVTGTIFLIMAALAFIQRAVTGL